MASDSFTFKQFTIRQDRCAMKVGTDGVLLGAWAAVEDCHSLLDIGTGTGLMALMAAQRAPKAHITAIEIEEEAAAQARENVATSPFARRIDVQQGDIRTWSTPIPFDAILCNPPYFEHALRCPNRTRSTARHDDTLTLEMLAAAAGRLLNDSGTLSVVLPTERRTDMVLAAATHSLFLTRETTVSTLPNKAPKRVLMAFARESFQCTPEKLCIEEVPGTYSAKYTALLRNFYLKL